MIFALLFLLGGFLLSFALTPFAIRLGESGVGLDHATESRKQQTHAIPRLGGAPIVVAALAGLAVIMATDKVDFARWFPVLLGSILMYGLGLWDDLRSVNAKIKLLGQVGIAALMYQLGLGVEKVSYPGGGWSVDLGAYGLPITILWLIALPNIVNLIDGLDGLAGGLGVFLSTTLGLVAIRNEQLPVAWFAFCLSGALLGFLFFNFPPARIYLGDGGAYLIGFCIAALSLISSNKGSIAAVLLLTVVALGLPILDTLFAITRRAMRGVPLFQADGEHIHHQLQRFGFSKRRIVLGLYAICVVLALLGLSIVWSQGRTLPIGLGALFVLALLALRYFHLLRNWDDVRRSMDRMVGVRRSMQYARVQAQLMELEVDRCRDAEEFWSIFQTSLQRVGFVHPEETEGGCLELQVRDEKGKPWKLHAPPPQQGSEERARREWQRLAECFRSVYIKAHHKWHP